MTSAKSALGKLEVIERPRRNGYGGLLLRSAANQIMPVLGETNQRERTILLKRYQCQLKRAISEVLQTTPARAIMRKLKLSRRQLELEIVLRLAAPFLQTDETANISDVIELGVPRVIPDILREMTASGTSPGDFTAISLASNIRHAHRLESYQHLADVIGAIYAWKPSVDLYVDQHYRVFFSEMFRPHLRELQNGAMNLVTRRVGRRLELLFQATAMLELVEIRYLACNQEPEMFQIASIVNDLRESLDELKNSTVPSRN